jgi:hypothetical protein
MSFQPTLQRIGIAAVVLAAIPSAIWTCVLLWAWLCMSRLPPEYLFRPRVARLYSYQVLLTLAGLLVLLATVAFRRRLSIFSRSVLSLCLGGIAAGLYLVVVALQDAGTDFYHVAFGHGAMFDQCTGVYGSYSELSWQFYFALGFGFAVIPSLANLVAWLASRTKQPNKLPSAGATDSHSR